MLAITLDIVFIKFGFYEQHSKCIQNDRIY